MERAHILPFQVESGLDGRDFIFDSPAHSRLVAALWGYATDDHCEGREWELVEYIQDQITSGMKRGLIVIKVADQS